MPGVVVLVLFHMVAWYVFGSLGEWAGPLALPMCIALGASVAVWGQRTSDRNFFGAYTTAGTVFNGAAFSVAFGVILWTPMMLLTGGLG